MIKKENTRLTITLNKHTVKYLETLIEQVDSKKTRGFKMTKSDYIEEMIWNYPILYRAARKFYNER